MSNITQDAAFVIAEEHSETLAISKVLYDRIMADKLAGKRNYRFATFIATPLDKVPEAWSDMDFKGLPPAAKHVEYKLLTGFDTESNDFLCDLSQKIDGSKSLAWKAEKAKAHVMTLSQVVRDHCTGQNLTKVWVQSPAHGSYDIKLAERLAQSGLEVCELDQASERFAVIYAAEAARLHGLNSESEASARAVMQFWNTVRGPLHEAGIQAVLLNKSMSMLKTQFVTSESDRMPQIVDTHELYLQTILNWLHTRR